MDLTYNCWMLSYLPQVPEELKKWKCSKVVEYRLYTQSSLYELTSVCASLLQVSQIAKSDLVQNSCPGAKVVGSLASALGHDLESHMAR